MRITGGEARGRTLRAPRGHRTRPTSDRVREALFSILASRQGDLSSAEVLDLYAGSGALGLEALSRGAAAAVLVDSGKGCARIIRANAAALGYDQRCQVMVMDAVRAVRLLQKQGRTFDLVLADPPYDLDTGSLLPAVAQGGLVRDEGLLVMEHRKGSPPDEPDGLALLVNKQYGDTGLTIYHVDKS